MTRRQKFFTGLAAAHVLLVAYSAFSLPWPTSQNPLAHALRWYGAVSGANNSYGFFKQVGSSLRVSFIMVDAAGKDWEDQLNRGFGKEADLRFNSNVNMISDFQDALATHWAAAMFGRHPTAVQVYVKLEIYDPGTMEEYRNGNRPEWKLTYAKGFTRKDLFPSSEGN
jgi:hypothetical protein